MERRRERRQELKLSARLRLLGPDERDLTVTVEEMSGAGARLRLSQAVPVSAPVRLEWADAMFLGECVHSSAAPDGEFLVGIHFEQVLQGLQDLRNLMTALMADSTGESRQTVTRSLSRRSRKPDLPPKQR
jgi:hypothetical protein